MSSPITRRRRHLLAAEFVTVAFMGLVAVAAKFTGVGLLLFPELSSLSFDVLARPRGKWASQPLRLIATPLLTGAMGLFVTRHMRYGALAILLIVVLCLATIRLLRSAIGPAISAGLLPFVLGERHWLYPPAIAAGLVTLAGVLWLWKRWSLRANGLPPETEAISIDDTLESSSRDRFWLIHLLAFVAVLGLAGEWTGLRFLLFPPLVVMAYELLAHPEVPAWIEQPVFFPLVCFLTASTGLLALRTLGHSPLGVLLTVAVSIALLQIFRMHMPPALAVGLLPFVSPSPDLWFPVSVGIGTSVLSVWFSVRSRFAQPALSKAIEG